MSWKALLLAIADAGNSAVDLFCKLLMLATGLGLLTLLTVVVVMRYGFSSGLKTSTELTELMFAIFVMAGIVQAARMGVHVATQLLLYILQGRWRITLSVFIHAATAATYLLLAWYALQNAIIAHDQTTPVLGIPWSVGYGCLALGLTLIALCSLFDIVRETLGEKSVDVNLADPGAAAT
jgi:TRAP-type C4-dicarboxylate transport system permease small subunit